MTQRDAEHSLHAQAHTHAYLHTNAHVSTGAQRSHMHAYARTCRHTHTHIHRHTQTDRHTHRHTHACSRRHTHARTDRHTHTHHKHLRTHIPRMNIHNPNTPDTNTHSYRPHSHTPRKHPHVHPHEHLFNPLMNTHPHTHTHIHERTHIFVRTHTHTHTHSLTVSHTHTRTHTHTYKHTHTHIHTRTHTRAHTHTLHTHTHTHTHTLAHTYTHTHTHAHTSHTHSHARTPHINSQERLTLASITWIISLMPSYRLNNKLLIFIVWIEEWGVSAPRRSQRRGGSSTKTSTQNLLLLLPPRQWKRISTCSWWCLRDRSSQRGAVRQEQRGEVREEQKMEQILEGLEHWAVLSCPAQVSCWSTAFLHAQICQLCCYMHAEKRWTRTCLCVNHLRVHTPPPFAQRNRNECLGPGTSDVCSYAAWGAARWPAWPQIHRRWWLWEGFQGVALIHIGIIHIGIFTVWLLSAEACAPCICESGKINNNNKQRCSNGICDWGHLALHGHCLYIGSNNLPQCQTPFANVLARQAVWRSAPVAVKLVPSCSAELFKSSSYKEALLCKEL